MATIQDIAGKPLAEQIDFYKKNKGLFGGQASYLDAPLKFLEDQNTGLDDKARFGAEFSKYFGKFTKKAQEDANQLKGYIDQGLTAFANKTDFSKLAPDQVAKEMAGLQGTDTLQRIASMETQTAELGKYGFDITGYTKQINDLKNRLKLNPEQLTGTQFTPTGAVRTETGFQTMEPTQSKSRAGESLLINPTTFEIYGKNTGNILGKGASMAEALAIQNQLAGGSTPSVAGRPDLYATTPLATEGQAYKDELTGQTVTPQTATPEQLAGAGDGTLQSYAQARGLTYLDGGTFASLQRNLQESDLVRDENGRIYLRPGLSVADVQKRSSGTVLQGEIVGTEDITLDIPSVLDPNALSDSITVPKTTQDIESLISQNKKLQDAYIASLAPSEEEKQIQLQMIELDTRINTYLESLQGGLDAIEDQTIPMAFITGQQASLERRSQRDLSTLTRYQEILAKRLGIATQNRELVSTGALAQVNFGIQNMELSMKIQEFITGQEDRVLERADKLRTESRNTLTSILSMFEGIDFEDLTPELQKSMSDLATSSGIPVDLLMEGMATVKNQMIQEKLETQLKLDDTEFNNQVDEVTKFASDLIYKMYEDPELTPGIAFNIMKSRYPWLTDDNIDSFLFGDGTLEGGSGSGDNTTVSNKTKKSDLWNKIKNVFSVGTVAGQCGRFVNRLTGVGVGDSFESKMAKTDKSIRLGSNNPPQQGDFFVMPYQWTGHTGFVDKVGPKKKDGTYDIYVLDSNWKKNEKVLYHVINSSKISGYGRVPFKEQYLA